MEMNSFSLHRKAKGIPIDINAFLLLLIDWFFCVINLDESGFDYQSETGALSVNTCGEASLGSLSQDQLLQLAPYLAIGLLACSEIGLLVLVVVVVVKWSRPRLFEKHNALLC
jgi:hypothetical protein